MVQSVPKFERGFGIYFHIPFCVHKCSYCDFYSFTRYETGDFSKILEAYCRELESGAQWIRSTLGLPLAVSSIFFGGGTPSLLPPALIQKILDCASSLFPVDAETEVTLEANPETVSDAYCAELAKTGVNRVSLGGQSFKTENLQLLERLGKRESIHAAAELLSKAGFKNLSVDLIFGIPGQTPESFLEDLDEACSLPVTHFSAYQLTLKPGHPLYTKLPSEDLALEFYDALETRASQLGFQSYEISNYSKLGRECRHNLLYWDGGDYLGIGPSASSRFFVDGKFRHRKQIPDARKYSQFQNFDFNFEQSDNNQTTLEASFLEMRKSTGVRMGDFERRYGYDFRKSANFELFKREGLIEEREGDLFLSRKGRLLADSVTSQLVDF